MPTGSTCASCRRRETRNYGDQNTDGSKSIRLLLNTMREAGATARQCCSMAAATTLERRAVSVSYRGQRGRPRRRGQSVCHTASWWMALRSCRCRRPPQSRLKQRAAWRYIGKTLPIIDLDDIVHGSAVFGIDVMLPGMRFASIERPPSYGDHLVSYRCHDALRVPGVERVVEIPGAAPPVRLPSARRRRSHRRQYLGGDAGTAEAAHHLAARP